MPSANLFEDPGFTPASPGVTSPEEATKLAALLRGLLSAPQKGSVMDPGHADIAAAGGLGEGAGLGMDTAMNAMPILKGVGLAGTLMGSGSKLWDAKRAMNAADLLKNNVPRTPVWWETGTAMGPEGKLRQEISDTPALLRKLSTNGGIVKDYLDHPELLQAYPDLGQMGIQSVKGRGAALNPNSNLISVGREEPNQLSNVMHELQHGVQQREGFAQGGSPDKYYPVFQQLVRAQYPNWSKEAIDVEAATRAYQQYKKLGGEVESRIVQKRLGMSPEDLEYMHPHTMGEVPLDQMVVKQNSHDPAYQDLTTKLVQMLRAKAGLP